MKTPPLPRRARSRASVFTLFAAPALAPLALAPWPSHASAATCGDTYAVHPGDSLWSISASCGVSTATLTRLNRLGAYLQPGQVLQLTDPYALRDYVVQPGDTLTGISQRLNIAPATLASTNRLGNLNLLRAGQVLHWRRADVGPTRAASAAPTTSAAASAAAATAAVPAVASGAAGTAYTVKPGDTLWSIARAQHLSIATLAAANGIADPRLLRAGRVIRIPTAAPAPAAAPAVQTTTTSAGNTTIVRSGVYTVRPGDTLWGIAQALGLTPDMLAQANNVNLATPIQPGQMLRYAVVVYNGPSHAEVGSVLDQQSAAVGVENALLKAIAWRESSWLMVDAPDGGIGVMQLMPDTVRWLQDTYIPGQWDPHDLTANVHAGAVILLVYSHLYNGDVAKIAAAYHGGMGAVTDAAMSTAEMSHYINTVIAFRQAFLNGTFP